LQCPELPNSVYLSKPLDNISSQIHCPHSIIPFETNFIFLEFYIYMKEEKLF